MTFLPPLVPGTLAGRYKRFLADVTLADGRAVTVHCPNTGAMLGCDRPGAPVWLSTHRGSRRKYVHGWELVETSAGVMVGINSGRANVLVREAIERGVLVEIGGYRCLHSEVRYGAESSRADFVLSAHPVERDCVVEVKSVTASIEHGVALFPDTVSARATRHLRELSRAARAGRRAVLVFCVQRDDVHAVRPGAEIDAEYAAALDNAMAHGVEVVAYAARVQPGALELYRSLEVRSRC